MKRKLTANLILVVLFAAAIAAVPLWWLFTPDRTFSEAERRNLTQAPAFPLEALDDWDFDNEVETYLADQMPLREVLVGINAYEQLWTGRQVALDVYRDRDGYLVEAPLQAEPEELERRLSRIAKLGETVGLPVRLLVSLVVNLAQAVWIPRGGYWYLGTVSGTVYHNTTYIALAPFAMLAMLCFYRAWRGMHGKLDARAWLVYTLFLTASTAFKANFVFAFAPALLLLLIADLVRTRGKNLCNEVIMGCSVLPSIALCLLESLVLFTGEGNGVQLIFSVDPVNFENGVISWGFFNEATRRGLIRSFLFVGAAALLLGRLAWGSFRYRFSALTFAVAMAEALLLVESGERVGHANFWWGAFICYWLFFLESVCALLRGWQAWRQNRAALLGGRLAVCTAALAWHIVSGVCFLVLLLQGNSYNIPIATWKLWF